MQNSELAKKYYQAIKRFTATVVITSAYPYICSKRSMHSHSLSVHPWILNQPLNYVKRFVLSASGGGGRQHVRVQQPMQMTFFPMSSGPKNTVEKECATHANWYKIPNCANNCCSRVWFVCVYASVHHCCSVAEHVQCVCLVLGVFRVFYMCANTICCLWFHWPRMNVVTMARRWDVARWFRTYYRNVAPIEESTWTRCVQCNL